MIFHKEAHRYLSRWILKCLSSLAQQTYTDFEVFELGYGVNEPSLKSQYSYLFTQKWTHWNQELPTHSHAMNVLLDRLFVEEKFDAVANVNIDDYYHKDRLRLQLQAIEAGADLVTSSFIYIQEKNRVDVLDRTMRMNFDSSSFQTLIQSDNVIAHPVVMYSRRMWRMQPDIEYRHEIPREDYELWLRLSKYPVSVVCIPICLLFYRIHANQITKITK